MKVNLPYLLQSDLTVIEMMNILIDIEHIPQKCIWDKNIFNKPLHYNRHPN